jgi:hypothetical protein
MPNRKAFDEREKYDHSGRPLGHAQKNDLKPDISEDPPGVATPGVATPGAVKSRVTRGPRNKPPGRPV